MADRTETYLVHGPQGLAQVSRNIETGERTTVLVDAAPAEGLEVNDVDVVDFEHMKIDELKAYADEHGVDLGEATKKADIIAVLEQAQE